MGGGRFNGIFFFYFIFFSLTSYWLYDVRLGGRTDGQGRCKPGCVGFFFFSFCFSNLALYPERKERVRGELPMYACACSRMCVLAWRFERAFWVALESFSPPSCFSFSFWRDEGGPWECMHVCNYICIEVRGRVGLCVYGTVGIWNAFVSIWRLCALLFFIILLSTGVGFDDGLRYMSVSYTKSDCEGIWSSTWTVSFTIGDGAVAADGLAHVFSLSLAISFGMLYGVT